MKDMNADRRHRMVTLFLSHADSVLRGVARVQCFFSLFLHPLSYPSLPLSPPSFPPFPYSPLPFPPIPFSRGSRPHLFIQLKGPGLSDIDRQFDFSGVLSQKNCFAITGTA